MLSRATIFWFTGLSGVGKSTLAVALYDTLCKQGLRVLVLDGDDVRNRLHRHLTFTPDDIRLNNTLIVGLCEESRRKYDAILVPVISPYKDSRAVARRRLAPGFQEIYVTADLGVLHARDTKGLYAAHRRCEIDNLIGVSPTHPYEVPEAPDLMIDTASESIEQSVGRLLAHAKRCMGMSGKKPNQIHQPRID